MTTAPAVAAATVAAVPFVHGEPIVVRSHPVDDPVELIGRLPAQGALAWVRAGDGLIGWGEAARFETTGEARFTEVEQWWTEFCAACESEGEGPVGFISFDFDPRPGRARLIVPKVVLRRAQGRASVTVIGQTNGSPIVTVPASIVPQPPVGVSYAEGALTAPRWAAAVDEAVERIVRGELDKVVLARDLQAIAEGPIDVRHLLIRLAARYPECWTFAVGNLVGATPELLVRRRGDQVTSRVLAGTVSRHGDDAADGELADALLASGKDLEEHEHAVHSVAAALAEHCTDLDVPANPHVLRLANVQHLATDVSGRLADGSSAIALAAALHPTAAVCGTPTDVALELIRELEAMDRGGYAGPVGWVGTDGDGEFGIALRCAEVNDDRLRLFAGCGIVAGSDPEAELAEAQAKFVAMRDALETDA